VIGERAVEHRVTADGRYAPAAEREPLGALERGEVGLPIQARRGTAERMDEAMEFTAVGAREGPARVGRGW